MAAIRRVGKLPVCATVAAIALSAAFALVAPLLQAAESVPGKAAEKTAGRSALAWIPGQETWADEVVLWDWRIQRSAFKPRWRLVDGRGRTSTSGSYEDCLAALDEVRLRHSLPPMEGKIVLILPGLGDRRSLGEPLAKYLREAGGYHAIALGYPSLFGEVDEHARSLARVVEHLDRAEEINVVAYSLGSIVTRRFLALAGADASRIKRVVMLAPPNHGAELAVKLASKPLLRSILGRSAAQLGREWSELEPKLATPECPFGIVAGGAGDDDGYNPLIPGDDDGMLSVATTRLEGASDFIRLPVLHVATMKDARVHEYTLRFLRYGYFISEARRQPL